MSVLIAASAVVGSAPVTVPAVIGVFVEVETGTRLELVVAPCKEAALTNLATPPD